MSVEHHSSNQKANLPLEHAEAALRTLQLLGGYLGVIAKSSNALYAWEDGLMTVRELKRHANAAAKMLKKDLSKTKPKPMPKKLAAVYHGDIDGDLEGYDGA